MPAAIATRAAGAAGGPRPGPAPGSRERPRGRLDGWRGWGPEGSGWTDPGPTGPGTAGRRFSSELRAAAAQARRSARTPSTISGRSWMTPSSGSRPRCSQAGRSRPGPVPDGPVPDGPVRAGRVPDGRFPAGASRQTPPGTRTAPPATPAENRFPNRAPGREDRLLSRSVTTAVLFAGGSGPTPTRRSLVMVPQASRLNNVRYDIRGPVLRRARQLEAEGHRILKLNIGTRPVRADGAGQRGNRAGAEHREAQGYSDARGIHSARLAVAQYYTSAGVPMSARTTSISARGIRADRDGPAGPAGPGRRGPRASPDYRSGPGR